MSHRRRPPVVVSVRRQRSSHYPQDRQGHLETGGRRPATKVFRDPGPRLVPRRRRQAHPHEERDRRSDGGRKTYIAPVIYFFGQWGFDDTVLEVVDGVISAAPHQNFAMAAELDGKSVEETAKVLSNARLRESTEAQLKAIGVDAG